MRPVFAVGRPAADFSPVSLFHDLPPSLVRNSPPPGPCETTGPYWSGPGHGPLPTYPSNSSRFRSHSPASSALGSNGSIRRSIAPVRSSTNSTFFHVLPPSSVLKTPRSSFGPHTRPIAATYTVFGSFG